MFKYNKIYPLIPITPNEQFLPITNMIVPNIKPYYFISNFGKVYHIHTGKFMKPAYDSNGYLFVTLSTENETKHCSIHRLVLLAFCPVINSEELQVNHKDGNKSNNSIYNLEWCTRSENVLHAYANNLNRTESIITEEQAISVCELLSEFRYTNKEISDMTNVPIHVIQDIKTGHSWRRIGNQYTFKSRTGRLFDEASIHLICEYFQSHKRECNINDFCREALNYLGMNTDDRYIETVRKIYTRKYYTNISSQYEY